MTRQKRIGPFVCLASATFLAAASDAHAQSLSQTLTMTEQIDVRGRGWMQMTNFDEMAEFGLTLAETVLLIALIAFHPVNRSRYGANGATDLRKGMFLFGLIGMITGFLVVHHGYLIGFVIFGIGGLFRFRMASSSIPETGQLVIVALIGLAAGLDLPVMALVGAVAVAIVLQLFGKTQKITLEVRFGDGVTGQSQIQFIESQLAEIGFRVVSVSKTKAKPMAQFELTSREPNAQALLVNKMFSLQEANRSGVDDWYLS